MEDGRILIRESGTQPLIRILIEHKSEIYFKAKKLLMEYYIMQKK
jgi:phosphomannomutase